MERVLLEVNTVEDAAELTARFVDEPARERRLVGVGAASLFALMIAVAVLAIVDGKARVEPIRIAVDRHKAAIAREPEPDSAVDEALMVTGAPDPEKYEPRFHLQRAKPKVRARHSKSR